jgi:signal peptidase I
MIEKFFKIIVNTFLFLLIIIGLLVVFSFIPIPGNYKVFTVQSGSMEPKIHTGSLIIVKFMDDYFVGDIVTRRTDDPKVTVTHRIYSKEEIDGQTAFKTKGDANDVPDEEMFIKKAIVGKEFLAIPYIGYPISYAKTIPGLILLIIIPAVIIVYDEMNKIKNEIQKIIMYRKIKKEEAEDNTL